MLSFGKFSSHYKGKTNKQVHARKYTHAVWSLASFGANIHPRTSSERVRLDVLQDRLRLNTVKLEAETPAFIFTQISQLIDDSDFIRAFDSDDPEPAVRTFANQRFPGVTDTPEWSALFPHGFFDRAYTDEIGMEQTYGVPVRTFDVPYLLGKTMAYAMMQELFEYRRKHELKLYQNNLYAELDLMFAGRIIHPITARIYELNGATYILFGEMHTYVNCLQRPRDAVTTGKFLIDLVAACPDVGFEVFSENTQKSYLPRTSRTVDYDEGEDNVDKIESCQDKHAFIMLDRKKNLLLGRSITEINQELEDDGFYDNKDDGADFSINRGLLSTVHLYFFTAYPMRQAWKSKGILGNVRLHIEDIRNRSFTRANQLEDFQLVSTNPRLAPIRDSIRDTALDDMFRNPSFKLPLDYVETIDFEQMTVTLKKVTNNRFKLDGILKEKPELRSLLSKGDMMTMLANPELAEVFMLMMNPGEDSYTDLEREITTGGSKIVARTARTIIATFERAAMKKFIRLDESLQRRLKTSFQDIYNRMTSRHMGTPLHIIIESILTDFYAMVRALNIAGQHHPAGLRKRVFALQAGAQHVEYWSHVLHALGAREFIFGESKDIRVSMNEKLSSSSVDASAMFSRLVELGVIQPTVSFTHPEHAMMRRVYRLIDEIKSSVVRPDTFMAVWDTFERLMLAEAECARTIRDGATDSKIMEVFVVVGTKIRIVLEMFIVDVTSLTQTAQTADVLERANFHLSGRSGSITYRIEKYKQEVVEGIVASKRKA